MIERKSRALGPALEYVFGSEIADELRREAGKIEEPEPCQPEETE